MTSEQLDEIRMLAACRDLSPDERAAVSAAITRIATLEAVLTAIDDHAKAISVRAAMSGSGSTDEAHNVDMRALAIHELCVGGKR